MKTRIYAAPAVKGLNNISVAAAAQHWTNAGPPLIINVSLCLTLVVLNPYIIYIYTYPDNKFLNQIKCAT